MPHRQLISIVVLIALVSPRGYLAAASPATAPARITKIGDRLVVVVTDLEPGRTESHQVSVNDKGEIRLPLKVSVKAVGLTCAELENAIRKAYAEPGIVHDCHPVVKFEK